MPKELTRSKHRALRKCPKNYQILLLLLSIRIWQYLVKLQAFFSAQDSQIELILFQLYQALDDTGLEYPTKIPLNLGQISHITKSCHTNVDIKQLLKLQLRPVPACVGVLSGLKYKQTNDQQFLLHQALSECIYNCWLRF